MTLVDRFIKWAVDRTPHVQPVVTFADQHLFDRYEFLRMDEYPDAFWDRQIAFCKKEGKPPPKKRPRSLPWWMPCNAFLHNWKPEAGFEEDFHDHPRWSITVCLKGEIIERTPWGNRLLRPGSIVVRSRKAIHGFALTDYQGEIWTLFIVGRRKYRQNTYVVTAK